MWQAGGLYSDLKVLRCYLFGVYYVKIGNNFPIYEITDIYLGFCRWILL